MADRWAGMSPDLSSPHEDAEAITTSDTVDITGGPTRAVYVGGAGAVRAILKSGADIVFAAVPVGTVLRIRATRIMATNTTATNLVALF